MVSRRVIPMSRRCFCGAFEGRVKAFGHRRHRLPGIELGDATVLEPRVVRWISSPLRTPRSSWPATSSITSETTRRRERSLYARFTSILRLINGLKWTETRPKGLPAGRGRPTQGGSEAFATSFELADGSEVCRSCWTTG